MIAALLTLPALAFGGPTFGKPRLKTRGGRVKLRIERVVSPQPAVLSGVVRDVDGGAIPGVSVSVRNEASKRVFAAVTNVDGAFNIPSLDDGDYRVDVTLDGFKPAVLEHLQLKASEVMHAAVALRLNGTTMTITVGAIAPDPMRNGGGSTTFSQDLINKLPL